MHEFARENLQNAFGTTYPLALQSLAEFPSNSHGNLMLPCTDDARRTPWMPWPSTG